MSFELLESDGVPIKAWIKDLGIEDKALSQLKNLSRLPFIHSHIAAMPDVSWGFGATVGSVIATHNAVIPAAVGVDIGCGMMAVRTSLTASDLPDNLFEIRCAIEKAVPHGRTNHGQAGDRGAWGNPPEHHFTRLGGLLDRLKIINDRHPGINSAAKQAIPHAGTLGGGNHFIEMCLDEEQRVWVMLHSGSRGVGNGIGSYFIDLAKKDMRRWFINLPDMDLAYIPHGSEHFTEYIRAVHWAQEYALVNRQLMMDATLAAIKKYIVKPFECDCDAVNCHHNYISMERHYGKTVYVTRKGAVSANVGELGIIPGSMGARSFIVSGKGNRESFCSCSHGAGRMMSRENAKKLFTLEDHLKATEGVECRKDIGVIDETPAAYKDIEKVMAAQSDLIDIKHVLKQIVCIKG